MELEKAIEELKRTIEANNRLLAPRNEQFFNKKERKEIGQQNNAISAVLQALEELRQKEKSRIIGNINEIKIEDLEPILKPYYISKEKVIDKIEIYKRLELESFNRDSIQADEYRAIIKALQELLEE